jgi:hypothetical protein
LLARPLERSRRAHVFQDPGNSTDGQLVPLHGPSLGFLTAPAEAGQKFPHMRPMIANAEVLADHLGDPEQCPEIGAIPRPHPGSASSAAPGPPRLYAGHQRFTELTEAENWRATADSVGRP